MGDESMEQAWRDLAPPFRRALQLAWDSLVARGLPVGAAITDESGSIVATGRNRAYDPPGGADALQQTPLAHAEMNALARVPTDAGVAGWTLWSTHRPCAMCAAAIDFIGLGEMRYLAADPSAEADAPTGGIWEVVSNTLFLHNIVAVAGRDHPTVAAHRRVEPETTALALELASTRTLIGQPSLTAALAGVWDRVVAAQTQRATRMGF